MARATAFVLLVACSQEPSAATTQSAATSSEPQRSAAPPATTPAPSASAAPQGWPDKHGDRVRAFNARHSSKRPAVDLPTIAQAYTANEVKADADFKGPLMVIDYAHRVGKDASGPFIELRRKNKAERVQHEVNDLVLQASVDMSDPRTAEWVAMTKPGDIVEIACAKFAGRGEGLSENFWTATGCILLDKPVTLPAPSK